MKHSMWPLYGIYRFCFVLKTTDMDYLLQQMNNIIANILPIGGIGYGMESHIIEGTMFWKCIQKSIKLPKSVRKNPRPVLIEFITFRRRGHEEASGTRYVPKDLMNFWETKDPISNFEAFLAKQDILSTSKNRTRKTEISNEIQQWFAIGF